MALVGTALDMTRIDPKDMGQGDTWQERLVTEVFWDVMKSEAVFYPFYTWILEDVEGNTELLFSYNGADYLDKVFEVSSTTLSSDISPTIIEALREYQG